MPRSRLTFLYVLKDTIRSSALALRKHGTPNTRLLLVILLLLGIIFAFLAFVPILSPFIYPLL